MTIKIAQPALALNSHDVPGAEYEMSINWKVPATVTADDVMSWIKGAAATAPGGRLRVVLINCHGYYNSTDRAGTGGFGLALGTGIRRADTPKFAAIKGVVDNIWITACGTARITKPGPGEGDGNLFCCEIAKQSGAHVVAATTHQDGDSRLPKGHIDDFEGLVLQYGPLGNVVWSHDYGRSWLDALVHGSN